MVLSRDFKENDSINVSVRNTFLDFSDGDDSWTVGANPDLRRQQTDSVLHRSSNLRQEIQNALARGWKMEEETQEAPLADFPNAQPPLPSLPEFANAIPHLEFQKASQFSSVPEFLNVPMGNWKLEDSQLPEFPNDVPMPISIDQDAFRRSERDDEDSEDGEVTSERQQEENSRASPELQALREIAANGGGLSGCTTVMLRYVPFKYTQRKLLREVNSLGFMGQYDFLYLPMDPRSHANRGFAFLNMISTEAADKFYQQFHGQYLRHFSADKPLAVLPADLQGFEENALQYAATGTHRGRRTGHTKPIFFRPLPAHIAAQIDGNKVVLSAPPAVQRSAPLVTNDRLPGQPPHYADITAQEMATAMLQQVLFPDTMKANMPATLQPQQMEPPRPAPRTRLFCVYCGKNRVSDHIFCPYCGNSFEV